MDAYRYYLAKIRNLIAVINLLAIISHSSQNVDSTYRTGIYFVRELCTVTIFHAFKFYNRLMKMYDLCT